MTVANISLIWMVWDDYDREWKATQRRIAHLEYQVTQAQLQQATTEVDRNKLQELEAARQAAEKMVEANQEKVDELEAALKAVDACTRENAAIELLARSRNSHAHLH